MIDFYSETEFKLKNKKKLTLWINYIVNMEGREPGEIMYVFCDDDYLLKVNKQFLNHDTLTDIITFDNSIGDTISGDIYIISVSVS